MSDDDRDAAISVPANGGDVEEIEGKEKTGGDGGGGGRANEHRWGKTTKTSSSNIPQADITSPSAHLITCHLYLSRLTSYPSFLPPSPLLPLIFPSFPLHFKQSVHVSDSLSRALFFYLIIHFIAYLLILLFFPFPA